ncbi:MarR family winged helix-turn-helix transcriptional regulator [Paraclostridium sordellii]|uniref:MarR family winged helix-turn-helix transcriptional regulator n=1 Tax=Paraclostridium sordellii TaxID=1505 RepID=UPI0005E94EEE|nr:helix-turn-helix domain-containing protein [Paeniclostridium sordellii]MCH1965415.1 MarR family transcriptional regulator [Paeniclostridium sordellii]CEO22367.1 MarR family transcriptional regulator [[Clostridium] sordellii] [Paeniclostridium sordellii]CEQ09206.1 MarR family transcriptional regulator [[Clostridium] sordellii] [Paeniclostridium sordellii]CEQ14231.1 MarR family transcriptional regulator [[Clostridium] sordellii] [Paeniclostridium sordellii]
MNSYLDNLNLIDLLSEKHAQLRKIVRDKWSENAGEYITDTESYIIALLERKAMTASQLARIIDISRQGVHKNTKNLIAKGYIEIENYDSSSRDKTLILTKKGEKFCEETLVLKNQLEKSIEEVIGTDNLTVLKSCLKETWF